MTQREQFEKWANAAKLDTARCCKDAWGKATYLPHIESMWFGWKAAQSQAFGVSVEPVNNDLADDIRAIDCIHRGDPSYEHDAYYMRKQAEKCVRHGYQLYTAEALAAARVQALEEAAKVCDRQAIPNAGFLAEKVRALINTNLTTGEMK